MIARPDWHAELHDLLDRLHDGGFDEPDRLRLNDLLRAGAPQREYFTTYMDVHSRLAWDGGQREVGERRGMTGFPAIDVSLDPTVEPPRQLDLESQISNSPFPSLSTTHYPLSPNFVGGPVFSYMVATVIMGVMLLGAWAYNITHFQPQIVGSTSPMSSSDVRPELVFVGRISGMKDCCWSDPQTEAYAGASVPLNRRYALSSGLMEITYKTGARVILEGPCAYTVESPAGGYLALGKLTAKVETRGEGRGARGDSHYPLPTIHYPLFSVRTPTAIITDLGTEFGVEVNKEGNTTSHVFRGSVKVQVVGENLPSPVGSEGCVVLRENESARVERGAAGIDAVIRRVSAAGGIFVRQIPRWTSFEVFSTGVGAKEGEADPHWKIIARSDDPAFKPRPAVVTVVKWPWFLANNPAHCQWISIAGDLPRVPNGVTYTFRTVFELPDISDAAYQSVVLRGGFMADNHVTAIRINDQTVTVPKHGYESPFNQYHPFIVKKWIVKGTNVLEIDVTNGMPDEYDEKDAVSAMALIVELKGYVLRGGRAPVVSPKTQQPHNGKEDGN